jgi:L-asparagine oxygenase
MLERTCIQEMALSPKETEKAEQFSSRFSEDAYGTDLDHYDRALREHLSDLPESLSRVARTFGNNLGWAGIVRVRGLPVQRGLPLTPSVSYSEIRLPTGTEPIVLGVAMLAGQPVAMKAWRGGDRVHNVYPLPADAETMKASGSVRLAMHTEAAFRLGAPDALVLLCLRAGSQPPRTGFCDLLPVWEQLAASERSLLAENAFAFPGAGGVLRDFKPVATLHQGQLRFQYDNNMRAATPEHEKALGAFAKGIEAGATETTLAAGDLFLIDNRHTAHGRSQYGPRYDGSDRWLQRCLVQARG